MIDSSNDLELSLKVEKRIEVDDPAIVIHALKSRKSDGFLFSVPHSLSITKLKTVVPAPFPSL